MSEGHISLSFRQFTTGGNAEARLPVAVEAPVSLTVNGEAWLTFQCTPTDLEALAVGFLYNEGFVRGIDEVEDVRVCAQKDNVDVWLSHPARKPAVWRRTAGCHGGAVADDPERAPVQPVNSQAVMRPEQIFHLLDQFFEAQTPHSEAGGIHTSAAADGGTLLFLMQDIGRHNTLDKIAGRMLLERITIQSPALLTSGRVSSEMALKAARMSAPFLVAMRSASQLAIREADEWGLTLISGARRGRFNLFTHPERIVTGP